VAAEGAKAEGGEADGGGVEDRVEGEAGPEGSEGEVAEGLGKPGVGDTGAN
jgi:hypothetical protein